MMDKQWFHKCQVGPFSIRSLLSKYSVSSFLPKRKHVSNLSCSSNFICFNDLDAKECCYLVIIYFRMKLNLEKVLENCIHLVMFLIVRSVHFIQALAFTTHRVVLLWFPFCSLKKHAFFKENNVSSINNDVHVVDIVFVSSDLKPVLYQRVKLIHFLKYDGRPLSNN